MLGTQSQRTIAGMLVIALVAVFYYAQYQDCGFGHGDEGSIALIGQRLLQGEIPFREVDQVGGLLWSASIALLFKLVGVDFIAMRIYFFGLALITAWLGYATVLHVTKRVRPAMVAGLLLVLLPGSLHKVYLPLVITAGMLLVVWIDFDRSRLGAGRMWVAGVVLGLTFLIRGDVALVVVAVFVASVVYQAVTRAEDGPWRALFRSFGISALAFAITMLPFYVYASRHGVRAELNQEAFGKLSQLVEVLESRLGAGSDRTQEAGEPLAGTLLQRAPLSASWRPGPKRVWALLTYLPGVLLAISIALLAALLVRCMRRGDSSRIRLVRELLSIGILAAATFPQFFFWRPDVAHLSQFMPGFMTFVISLLGFRPLGISSSNRRRAVLSAGYLVLFGCVLVYVVAGLQQGMAGSIGRCSGASKLFEAANGVRVRVKPAQHRALTRLRDAILAGSRPEDWVVCYPYCPGFNFMTDRRTYLVRDYVDDRRLIAQPDWPRECVAELRLRRPAVVVIGRPAFNGTRISRFPVWAKDVYAYVAANYEKTETAMGHEVFVRVP